MKLVDILAKELKAWPEGLTETVGQCHDGSLHGYAGGGHPNCQNTRQRFSMGESYATEKVTRAEWQSAVDALKLAPRSDESQNVVLIELDALRAQLAERDALLREVIAEDSDKFVMGTDWHERAAVSQKSEGE